VCAASLAPSRRSPWRSCRGARSACSTRSERPTPLPLKPVGLLGTDASFDATRRNLADAARLLAKLSGVTGGAEPADRGASARRRSGECAQVQTSSRGTWNTIRFIESALQEEERNMLFQIKILRAHSAEAVDS